MSWSLASLFGFRATHSDPRTWENVEVELRPATEDEKPGRFSRIYNFTTSLLSTTLNTVTLIRKLGFFQEMLESKVKEDPFLANFNTWLVNFNPASHPEVMKAIFREYRNDPDGCFAPSDAFLRFLKELFPDQNVTNEDAILICQKEPSELYRGILKKVFHENLHSNDVLELTEKTLSEWEQSSFSSQKPINVSLEAKRFTTGVISRLFLGNYEVTTDLIVAIDKVVERLSKMRLEKKAKNAKELEACMETLREAIDNILGADIESPLLSAMKEKGLTLTQQRIMIFMIIFAGQDTSANLLSYLILKLAQDHQLFEDIRSGKISVEAFIAEGLRLFNPAGFVGRDARKDLTLVITNIATKEKIIKFIPKGANVAPASLFAALDKSIAGSEYDPNIFEPRRWDGKEINDNLSENPQLSFGFSRHRCPGHSVAKLEITTFLEEILKNYTLSTSIEGEPRKKTVFTTRMVNDAFVFFARKP